MYRTLDWLSRLVTARPWATISVLVMITVALAAGTTLRAPPAETSALLPKDSAVAIALDEIEELFGESGDVRVATLIFRGAALTPDGLAQMDALIRNIATDPSVAALLAPPEPIVAPSIVIGKTLGVDSFESVSQAHIDALGSHPQIGAALDAMSGLDADGSPVAVGSVRLRDTGDDRISVAELRIAELASASVGPLRVNSMSFTTLESEYSEATRTGLRPLMGLALLLVAALILLFMRSFSDLLLTLSGLIMSLVWINGAEGWLGPNGLGIVGPPNVLTAMVPIILIGLSVDYAIQAVSHYRERRIEGERPLEAVRAGLGNVSVPLVLAGVTTMASFMAGLFSPVEMVGDFGVISAVGVGLSLIVMLTLIPAGRTIIDRRREAKGTLTPTRPISGALPGVERLAELLGREVTRRPAPYIVAVVAAAVALGFAARDLDSEFSVRDLLPRGGSSLTDMETLDSAVGGRTEIANLLVKAEANETRTLLNLRDLRLAFQNELRRPQAAAGPISTSYELLIQDWITDSGGSGDSGERGDKYDAELAALFREASAGLSLDPALMREFFAKLEVLDPAVGDGMVSDPEGMDAILVQFPAYMADPSASMMIQEEIEALWFGEDDTITATSQSIVNLAIADAIKDRQTQSIGATIAVALVVLSVFFWLTLRQPALAFVAVAPTVLVLVSVLGTMALLDIPYTFITSVITALSIGIGVDYTIHLIHRYREEYSRDRNPERAAITDALYHRLGAAGFDDDDGARHRGTGGVADGGISAVRHNGGYHYLLLADSVGPGGAALDDGLGGVSEYAPALGDRARVGGVGRDDRRDTAAAWGLGAFGGLARGRGAGFVGDSRLCYTAMGASDSGRGCDGE